MQSEKEPSKWEVGEKYTAFGIWIGSVGLLNYVINCIEQGPYSEPMAMGGAVAIGVGYACLQAADRQVRTTGEQ